MPGVPKENYFCFLCVNGGEVASPAYTYETSDESATRREAWRKQRLASMQVEHGATSKVSGDAGASSSEPTAEHQHKRRKLAAPHVLDVAPESAVMAKVGSYPPWPALLLSADEARRRPEFSAGIYAGESAVQFLSWPEHVHDDLECGKALRKHTSLISELSCV
jgi:hypothetical protein